MADECLDFDGLGDPLVNFSVLNNDQDADAPVGSDQVVAPDIPVAADQAVEPKQDKLSEEGKEALKLLRKGCLKFGVPCTEPMINQIKTLSKGETISESHLVWYIRGIIIANGSMLLPSITDSTSELRSESRHLLNVVNTTVRNTTALNTSAEGFSKAMDEAVAGVKEMFSKTLEEVSKSYEERIRSMTERAFVPPREILVLPAELPKEPSAPPPVLVENKDKEERIPEKTVADNAALIKMKRSFLQSIGTQRQIMAAMDDEVLNSILSNDDYTTYKTMTLTPAVAVAIRDIVMKELKKLSEKGKSKA